MRFRFGTRTLLVTTAVIAIAFGGWRWFADWLDPFNDHRFTSSTWTRSESPESLALMSRDLVDHHLHLGMSKTEVVAMLGQPGKTIHGGVDSGGNRLRGDETYSYYIGSWSMYGLDDAFVYVHFDSSDQVIEAEITGY